MKKTIDKLRCWLFNHIITGKKYSKFDFGDGLISWAVICPGCNKIIYCIKGYCKSDPDYICKTELMNQSKEAKDELMKYPL